MREMLSETFYFLFIKSLSMNLHFYNRPICLHANDYFLLFALVMRRSKNIYYIHYYIMYDSLTIFSWIYNIPFIRHVFFQILYSKLIHFHKSDQIEILYPYKFLVTIQYSIKCELIPSSDSDPLTSEFHIVR